MSYLGQHLFCLGLDIADELYGKNQLRVHYTEWVRFGDFLRLCQSSGIRKLYITGQNTDALLYEHLDSLITFLQVVWGFDVGLRTNGYGAVPAAFGTINKCRRSVGYSIHTLSPVTSRMILGRPDVPDWNRILPATTAPCRVSIVVNRCNEHEFFNTLRYVSKFPNVAYIQARRVSTDRRLDELAPDIAAYERTYTTVRSIFPVQRTLWGDADEFEIYGKPVVFWRTVQTTVNSFNYFTDGTISDEYFVVEGYLKHRVPEDGRG